MSDIYFSSFSGLEVDTVIKAFENMPFQIVVSTSTSGVQVQCTCSELNYNETKTSDSNNKCIFDIPGYGEYSITKNNSTQSLSVNEFRIYTVS